MNKILINKCIKIAGYGMLLCLLGLLCFVMTVPAFNKVRATSQDQARKNELRQLKAMIEAGMDIPATPLMMKSHDFNTEQYDSIRENRFLSVLRHPLSTFSVDVDTASYANSRRFINIGELPPAGAVRIEEFINYFDYDYEPPEDKEEPFKIHLSAAPCPWNESHDIVGIGLKGYEMSWDERPTGNFVFLIDTSGSMDSSGKISLVRRSLVLLVHHLDERDTLAIVTYAGSSQILLPPTNGSRKEAIYEAIDQLEAGGSTHASAGIIDAYRLAAINNIEGGNNRVILCTDGDFNVGVTNRSDLVSLIREQAASGVFLNIYGFGMGNYKDATLEELSNKGNGQYGYVDSYREAGRLFSRDIDANLITIASDVKIQVEFNPAVVNSYRLIGYENRTLSDEDFNDDTRDAGEVGSGHSVTALYEIIPSDRETPCDNVDPLIYQPDVSVKSTTDLKDILTVKLRYKRPESGESELLVRSMPNEISSWQNQTIDFRFAVAVSAFAQKLRGSSHIENYDWEEIINAAEDARGSDDSGDRAEFIQLAREASRLDPKSRGHSIW